MGAPEGKKGLGGKGVGMMDTGIGGSLVIRNGDAYDYNWREAILSVLPICDHFVILEAYSDKDDTYMECLKLAEQHPKITVMRGVWDGDEPEGHEYFRLARLTNCCLDEIKAMGLPWFLYVQGDEAYHEDGLETLVNIAQGKGRYEDSPSAIMVPFHHFVGNPWTTFPFVYQSAWRMAKTDSPWRAFKDAWTLRPVDGREPFYTIADESYCFHYGKMGDPIKKLLKQDEFQMLFTSHGFPDPRIAELLERGEGIHYAYLFRDALEKGLFQPFAGTHPAVMKDWLEAHKDCWEMFTDG